MSANQEVAFKSLLAGRHVASCTAPSQQQQLLPRTLGMTEG